MSGDSRIFWHDDGAEPRAEHNEKTVLGASLEELAASDAPVSIRECFEKHYRPIREWLQAHAGRPGAALVVMGPDAVRAAGFVASKPQLLGTAVLGRHSKADIRLTADPNLSLRHVALLLFPGEKAGPKSRYRLLDLRSASAFVDERGKRLRALESDGLAFVRLGQYVLLVFGTGEAPTEWPENPEEGWNLIPDRLYLDEVETQEKPREWEAASDRAWGAEDLASLSEPPTLVHSVPGPEMAVHELLEPGESARGELFVTSTRGEAKVVVGQRAAEAGVLLGRSRRCDAGKVLSDRSVSRVHLLVIEIAGELYAVDTASSNGVFEGKERERATPLTPGMPLALGDAAHVEWRAV